MPASRNHRWSFFKAWRDWKIVCSSFVDSDVCSEHELKRRADYLGIPVAQLRWVSSYDPTQSASWSAARKRFRSIRTKSLT